MTTYDAKSIIIGRMKRPSKDDSTYPCFISLFQIHDPHKSGEVPEKILDFEHVRKVIINGLDISYQLAGNDLVIDNLSSFTLEEDGEVLTVSGKQK
jgi:hypothetical protein